MSFLSGCLRHVKTVLTTYMYMYFLFCGVCRLAVRWIFLLKWDFYTTKKDGSTGPTALESDWPYFEIMGHWPGPTINLKAWDREHWTAESFVILPLVYFSEIPQFQYASHLDDFSNFARLVFNWAMLSSYLLKKSIPLANLSALWDSLFEGFSETTCSLLLLWLSDFTSLEDVSELELSETSLPVRDRTTSPFTISQSSLTMWLFSAVTGTYISSRKNKLSFVHSLFSLLMTSTWNNRNKN